MGKRVRSRAFSHPATGSDLPYRNGSTWCAGSRWLAGVSLASPFAVPDRPYGQNERGPTADHQRTNHQRAPDQRPHPCSRGSTG
jgi:hypothetical protein